jgi:hypothetical protein
MPPFSIAAPLSPENFIPAVTAYSVSFAPSSVVNQTYALDLQCGASCPSWIAVDGTFYAPLQPGPNTISFPFAPSSTHVVQILSTPGTTNPSLSNYTFAITIPPPIDTCAGIVCSNGGTCLSQSSALYHTSYTCYCTAAWSGITCDQPSGAGSGGGGGGSTTPVTPVVVCNAPSSVTSCDSALQIDGRASYNLGPVTLQSTYRWTWTVTSILLNGVELIDSASAVFNQTISDAIFAAALSSSLTGSSVFPQRDIISIPTSSLLDGGLYSFHLQISVPAGGGTFAVYASSISVQKVGTVSPPWTPLVVLRSPARLVRPLAHTFRTDIIPSACQPLPLDVVYTFAWIITMQRKQSHTAPGDDPSSLPTAIRTVTSAARELEIPAFFFYPGYVYSISLSTSIVSATGVRRRLLASSQTTAFVQNSGEMAVQQSDIIAKIVGGDRSRRADQLVVISADQSSDPDYIGTNPASAISFVWTCRTSGSPCVLSPSIVLTDAAVSIPASTFTAGNVYVWMVVVSSTVNNTRYGTDSIALTVTSATASPPIVTILNAPVRIHLEDALRLVGTVVATTTTSVNDLLYRWSITSPSLTAAQLPRLDDATVLGAPANTASLVLLAGVLTPGSYQLTLTVSDPKFVDPGTDAAPSAFAAVTIIVSEGPQAGVCTLSPTSGEALTTRFTMTCSQWFESQAENFQPFKYAVQTRHTTATEFSQVTAFGYPTTMTFFLSPGQQVVRALVRDSDGATASVDIPAVAVTVSQQAVFDPFTYVASTTVTTLIPAVNAHETSDAINIVEQLAAVLNVPVAANVTDISRAPPLYAGLADQLVAAWEQCSVRGPNGKVEAVCIAITSQALAVLTAHAIVFPQATLDQITKLTEDVVQAAVDSNLQLSPATLAALSTTASNLMIACGQLDYVSEIVHRLLQAQQSHAVAGEQLSLSTSSFTAVVKRNLVSQGTTIDLGNGESVSLSAEAMAAYAAQLNTNSPSTIDTSAATAPVEMDTRIVTFATRFSGCRGASSLSDITSIELTFPDGRPVNISALPGGITFRLPLSLNATRGAIEAAQDKLCAGAYFNATEAANEAFTCSFWNTQLKAYSTLGCQSQGVYLAPDGGVSTLTCNCNHLTEFAVIFQEATLANGGCAPPSTLGDVSYLVFMIAYLLVMAISGVQLIRVVRRFPFLKYWLITIEHSLICGMCFFRALNQLIYWNLYTVVPLVPQAILAGMPYCFISWIFTFVVMAWASIYLASQKGLRLENPFEPYKRQFVLGNTAICVTLFLVFISMAISDDLDHIRQLNKGGTGLTAIVELGFAAFLSLWGGLLVRSLTRDFFSPYAKKLAAVAASLSLTFGLSACVLIFSIANEEAFNEHLIRWNCVYYLLDIVALCIVLGLFQKSIQDAVNSADGATRATAGASKAHSTVGTNTRSGTTAGLTKVVIHAAESRADFHPMEEDVLEKDVPSKGPASPSAAAAPAGVAHFKYSDDQPKPAQSDTAPASDPDDSASSSEESSAEDSSKDSSKPNEPSSGSTDSGSRKPMMQPATPSRAIAAMTPLSPAAMSPMQGLASPSYAAAFADPVTPPAAAPVVTDTAPLLRVRTPSLSISEAHTQDTESDADAVLRPISAPSTPPRASTAVAVESAFPSAVPSPAKPPSHTRGRGSRASATIAPAPLTIPTSSVAGSVVPSSPSGKGGAAASGPLFRRSSALRSPISSSSPTPTSSPSPTAAAASSPISAASPTAAAGRSRKPPLPSRRSKPTAT